LVYIVSYLCLIQVVELKKTTVGEGSACGQKSKPKLCDAGLVCIQTNVEKAGTCQQPCILNSDCKNHEQCVADNNGLIGGFYCAPKGHVAKEVDEAEKNKNKNKNNGNGNGGNGNNNKKNSASMVAVSFGLVALCLLF